MKYRKLKRVWSHSHANYIPNFDKVFPELKHLYRDEMCDRFRELNLDFFTEELKPVPFWLRLTMPFAILTAVLMIISLPILFLMTGKWSYSLGDENRALNWMRALRLL